MRFNSLGHGLTGTSAGTIAIDGVNVGCLVGFPAGDASLGLGWIDDDDFAIQANFGAGFKLYSVKVSTNTPTMIDGSGTTSVAAGNGVVQAYLTSTGVRTNVSGFGPFPLAGLGDTSPEGLSVLVQSFSAGTGLVTFSAAGSSLQTIGATLPGNYLIRAKGGVVAYPNGSLTGGWHMRNMTSGVLQSFAPRTEAIFQSIPIQVSGAQWIVEVSGTQLTARPATSSNGFVIATGDTFGVDAVEVSAGVLRMGWCINAGETNTSLRMADLTIATGGFSTGTTASGSLVFTAQPTQTPSAIPVGPVEGGSGTAQKQPRYAIKNEAFVGGESGKRIYQKYWDQISSAASGPVNLSQTTGTLSPAQGGTGTTTGVTVLNGANLTPDTTPLDTAQAFGPFVLQTGRNLILTTPLTISTFVQLNGTANLRVV